MEKLSSTRALPYSVLPEKERTYYRTREQAADLTEFGSPDWRLCTLDTENMTKTQFIVATGISESRVNAAVRRLKHKYHVDIEFLPDDMEPFDHDEYRSM